MKKAQASSNRWLAERARPLMETPLQKNSTRTYIHLTQGTPDLPTPRHAIQAVVDYLRDGRVYYTYHDGMPELRAAISQKLERENRLHYDPESEIIVTAGAQEGMFVALFSTLNPGDEVIVADPRYPVYDEVIRLVGGTVVTVPAKREKGFQLDAEAIESAITPRTRAILVISPDHPSGAVQSRSTLEAVGSVAEKHDLLIFSDELYERFIFDGAEHVSVGSLPGLKERTITLNGFSKAYAMTGWRVGYLGVPAEIKPALTEIKHDTSICAATPSQIAALAVLTGPQAPLAEMMSEWSARRDYLYARLEAMGIGTLRTAGAYFVLFDISASGLSSSEFAKRLAEEEGVRVSAGTGFGKTGEGLARASFMTAMPELTEGLDRLEHLWRRLT